jgi:hypothetical protein
VVLLISDDLTVVLLISDDLTVVSLMSDDLIAVLLTLEDLPVVLLKVEVFWDIMPCLFVTTNPTRVEYSVQNVHVNYEVLRKTFRGVRFTIRLIVTL